MTEIRYKRRAFSFEMEGHAGAGTCGNDLVCAALSTLAQTLEKRCMELCEQMQPEIRKRSGYIHILCKPTKSARQKCRQMMDTIYAGCALLADNFPENVRLHGEN